MNTILVPLDGSALAEQVLPQVSALALALDAKVCLLQVVAEPERNRPLADSISEMYGAGESPEQYEARQRRALEERCAHAEGYLSTRAALLQAAGLPVAVEVRVGPAPEIIGEVAAAIPARLIALATHGYSGLRRWAVGSVADKVVHTACAPVLLVRGHIPAHPEDTPPRLPPFALRRILVPIDGSGFSRQALPFAAELATSSGADLVLLQAIAPTIEGYPSLFAQPSTPYSAVLRALHEQAVRELDALAGELRAEGLQVSPVVSTGHPAEAIVDEAARRGASAIVMATHGRGGLSRWALGSVADKVLHATTTPLVLVRAWGELSTANHTSDLGFDRRRPTADGSA
jgi:nucleotide-binding universal stress UspA family protein